MTVNEATKLLAHYRPEFEGAFQTFLVRGPGCWGRGKSIREAVAHCLNAERGPARKAARLQMRAFVGDETLTISTDGFVSARWFLLDLGEI